MDRHLTGRWGEEKAAAFLRRKGYKIIGMNYACRMGEIDIIARRRGLTAFIEVKRRRDTRYGRPAEAVNLEKQRRIAQAAALYMQENALEDARVRFDVIEILPDGLRHIEDAFDATGLF